MSASVTPAMEALSRVPTSGVASLMVARPVGPSLRPGTNGAAKLANCSRSMPVRRSTPSIPMPSTVPSSSRIRWVTVITSSEKSSVVPLLSMSIW
ncbi:hypothetical protein D9M71_724030 [compost metagenome]